MCSKHLEESVALYYLAGELYFTGEFQSFISNWFQTYQFRAQRQTMWYRQADSAWN